MYSKLRNTDSSIKDILQFTKLVPDWSKNKPKMSGYLKKEKLKAIGKAQKRYFFLKNKFLWYYKSPLDLEPVSAVCLETMQLDTTVQNKKNCFKLEIPGSTWVMDALGDKLHSSWVQALQETTLDDVFSVNLQKEKQQAESAVAPQPAAAVTGYLFKRGFQNMGWKQRWFELRNDLLSYFENPSAKAKGSIDLKGSSLSADEDEKDKFCFQLKHDERKYFFYAEKEEERAKWIAALSKIPTVDTTELSRPKAVVASVADVLSAAASPANSGQPQQRFVVDAPLRESARRIGPAGVDADAPEARRASGELELKKLEEVKKLETPTVYENPLERTGVTAHDVEERRRNEEAIRRTKERRSRTSLDPDKTRQAELRERLLDGTEEDLEEGGASSSSQNKCCQCTIV